MTGSVPVARKEHTVTVNGDTAYLFGGRGGNGVARADLFAFDFKSKTWTELTMTAGTAPQARYGHSATAVGDATMLLVGGYSTTDKALGDVWRLAGGKWMAVQCNVIPRAFTAVAMAGDGRLILHGGESAPGVAVDSLEALSANISKSCALEAGNVGPAARAHHCAFSVPDGRVCVVADKLYFADVSLFKETAGISSTRELL